MSVKSSLDQHLLMVTNAELLAKLAEHLVDNILERMVSAKRAQTTAESLMIGKNVPLHLALETQLLPPMVTAGLAKTIPELILRRENVFQLSALKTKF
jgi:hypothetical protein